jgi:hypothetical protein
MDTSRTISTDVDEGSKLRLEGRVDCLAGRVDLLKLPLDFVETVVHGLRLGCAILESAFECLDQIVILDTERLDADLLFVGQWPADGMKLVKLALQVKGHMGSRDRSDEGKTVRSGELRGF